jgi:hypothetical protein
MRQARLWFLYIECKPTGGVTAVGQAHRSKGAGGASSRFSAIMACRFSGDCRGSVWCGSWRPFWAFERALFKHVTPHFSREVGRLIIKRKNSREVGREIQVSGSARELGREKHQRRPQSEAGSPQFPFPSPSHSQAPSASPAP